MQKAVMAGLFVFMLGLTSIGVVYIPDMLNPKETKLLLDLNTEPSRIDVQPGNSIEFVSYVKTPGYNNLVNAKLEHNIISIKTGDIVLSKSDSLDVRSKSSKQARALIAKDTELGYYVLETNAYVDGQKASSAFLFKVFKREAKPSCFDNMKNQNEEGIDCGGPCKSCTLCENGFKDGEEEGIDCGGDCKPCAKPSCDDGIKNQDETGVDCGGSCEPCPEETCYDGIKNQDEENTDCGGVCESCSSEDIPFEQKELMEQLVIVRDATTKNPEEGYALCQNMLTLDSRDECVSRVAEISNSPGYCTELKSVSKKDLCYMNFALKGNYAFCDRVSNINLRNSCLSLERRK
ncbi:hypothetical protein JXA85_04865 [Candidatus Woesearchaeota archaeon]|nr:hypothetical protein [Candidatus Woesearchaeota archaeon]